MYCRSFYVQKRSGPHNFYVVSRQQRVEGVRGLNPYWFIYLFTSLWFTSNMWYSHGMISKLSLKNGSEFAPKLKQRTTKKMTSVRCIDGSSTSIIQEAIVCAGYQHRQTPTLRDINLARRLTAPTQRDTKESYAPIFRKRRVIKPTTQTTQTNQTRPTWPFPSRNKNFVLSLVERLQMDHAIPIMFEVVPGTLPSMEEILDRLYWTNIQPMKKQDNMSKGNRRADIVKKPRIYI